MARIYGYSDAEIAEMAEARAKRAERRVKRLRERDGQTWIAPEHVKDAREMKRDGKHRLIIDLRPQIMRPSRPTRTVWAPE